MRSQFKINLKKNYSLKNLNTFYLESRAEFFQRIKDEKDLFSLLKEAKKRKLKIVFLGAGSNVLLKEKIKGLVVKIDNQKLEVKRNRVVVGAGFLLPELVKRCQEKGLGGLEWASGIPGTVGGAVFGNAGSFSYSISDFVRKVKSVEIKTGKIILRNKDECLFGYRKSIFQKKKEIIWEVELLLRKENKRKIKEKIEEFSKKRRKSQPIGCFCAGSIFKNVPLKKFPKKIQKEMTCLFGKSKLIPAGYLIEKSGLKGKRIGQAKISEKHSNFIVNLGKAKERDIEKLISLVKTRVQKKFGVVLEEEVQRIE